TRVTLARHHALGSVLRCEAVVTLLALRRRRRSLERLAVPCLASELLRALRTLVDVLVGFGIYTLFREGCLGSLLGDFTCMTVDRHHARSHEGESGQGDRQERDVSCFLHLANYLPHADSTTCR